MELFNGSCDGKSIAPNRFIDLWMNDEIHIGKHWFYQADFPENRCQVNLTQQSDFMFASIRATVNQ